MKPGQLPNTKSAGASLRGLQTERWTTELAKPRVQQMQTKHNKE
jgi:hypothetical protein